MVQHSYMVTVETGKVWRHTPAMEALVLAMLQAGAIRVVAVDHIQEKG
jgi:hypothetical protein